MVNVTYRPPPGEPAGTKTLGLEFEAGKAVPIDETDEGNKRILAKMEGHPHFQVGDDPNKPKRGRPRKLTSEEEVAARKQLEEEQKARDAAQSQGLRGAARAKATDGDEE